MGDSNFIRLVFHRVFLFNVVLGPAMIFNTGNIIISSVILYLEAV